MISPRGRGVYRLLVDKVSSGVIPNWSLIKRYRVDGYKRSFSQAVPFSMDIPEGKPLRATGVLFLTHCQQYSTLKVLPFSVYGWRAGLPHKQLSLR